MTLAAESQMFVSDLAASLAWFDRVGFATVFVHGDPSFYAHVAQDGARMNLRRVEGPVFDRDFRSRNMDALAATLVCDDVAERHARIVAAGVTLHQPLRREPWGAQTFILADPDGNLLLFAGA